MKISIFPSVSNYVVEKFVNNSNLKNNACTSILSMGVSILGESKEIVAHEFCIQLKEIKPSKNIVVASSLVFSILKSVLSFENRMKSIMKSTSSS